MLRLTAERASLPAKESTWREHDILGRRLDHMRRSGLLLAAWMPGVLNGQNRRHRVGFVRIRLGLSGRCEDRSARICFRSLRKGFAGAVGPGDVATRLRPLSMNSCGADPAATRSVGGRGSNGPPPKGRKRGSGLRFIGPCFVLLFRSGLPWAVGQSDWRVQVSRSGRASRDRLSWRSAFSGWPGRTRRCAC